MPLPLSWSLAMSTFSTLREANIVRQKEWDPTDKITPSFQGNELAGEVGELCNLVKKFDRHRMGLKGGKVDLDAIKEEIGDIVICLDLLAIGLGVQEDINELARRKFNKTSAKYGLTTRVI